MCVVYSTQLRLCADYLTGHLPCESSLSKLVEEIQLMTNLSQLEANLGQLGANLNPSYKIT